MTSMFDKSLNELSREIFRYAAPVLVGTESMKLRHPENEKWFLVLQTTRILLAHYTLITANHRELCRLIANNMRNLYRLYALDLSCKDDWEDVSDNTSYYVTPNVDGVFCVSLNDCAELIGTLQSVEYAPFLEEFNRETNRHAKDVFGHTLYKLVATLDGLWKQEMQQYSTFC